MPATSYKVISIDMFQTLVNVDSRLNDIWRRILEADYDEALAQRYIASTSESIVDAFHRTLSQRAGFKSLNELFVDCFTEIFSAAGVDYSPETATTIFMDEHNNAAAYDDSLEFVRRARRKYRVCLVSDADPEMVEAHLESMQFDDVFISGITKSYKGNPDGRMFRSVLEHYDVEPGHILHIGDSSSDINGAARARIDSCWINRHDYGRHFDAAPTYEVESLASLYPILDI